MTASVRRFINDLEREEYGSGYQDGWDRQPAIPLGGCRLVLLSLNERSQLYRDGFAAGLRARSIEPR